MSERPSPEDAAPYYFTYIDKVPEGDVIATLERQLGEASAFFAGISEERSLHRYAAGKWSIREMLNHINDAERLFTFRALWFARGFADALPSFEQDQAVATAAADAIAWPRHVEEFRGVRLATLALFRNLPEEAWSRRGIASGNPFTVRALAFIAAGHLEHHLRVLRERYL